MGGVIVGPQNSAETLAGRLVKTAQKGALVGFAIPAIQHGNTPSVLQNERRHIDRIAISMLG